MKKLVWIILIFVAVVALYNYWPALKNAYTKAKVLSKTVNTSSALSQLEKEILAPTPLRSSENSPDAFLTRLGVISLTNIQREQNGAAKLTENSKLDQAAQLKLKDMFAKQYFEHISPSGVGPGDLAAEVHYDFISVGENLALGNFKDDQALVQAWMNSPGHRANILNAKFMEIGVAVGQGTFQGQSTWLAVQEFGKPASSCPAVDAGLKIQIDSLTSQVQGMEADINAKQQQLSAMPLKTRADYDNYNQQVTAFNQEVAQYNQEVAQLKSEISQYNSQVSSFNACVGQS